MPYVDIHREEVRGVFVLGIIATLVVSKDYLSLRLPSGSGSLYTTYIQVMILDWGLYAVFMAIAVSDDLFSETAVRFCNSLGRTFFQSGILILVIGVLTFGFGYIFSTIEPTLGDILLLLGAIPALTLSSLIYFKAFKGVFNPPRPERRSSK